MQDIAGLSVIGKTGSGSGNPAEITAATSGHVLRYDGTNVAFGTLASGAFAATTNVPLNALADQAALSVVANGSNASASPTAIAAGTDGHVLRRSGTAVGFGTIVNAGVDANAAIALSKLASMAQNTVVGVTTAGVPTALTTGSGGTAKTALGLGTAAYSATGDFTPNPQTAAGVGQIQVWSNAGSGSGNASVTVGATGQNWAVWYFTIGSDVTSREISNVTSGVYVTSGSTQTITASGYSYGKAVIAIGIRLA